MLRINNFTPTNQIKYVTSPNFRGKMPEAPEKKESEKQEKAGNVTPDFNVRKPMAYSKLYDVDLPFDMKAHYYKLANGQKVIIVPREGATVLKTYVNTGSMNETDNIRGISHFLEHNFFNGSDGLEKGEFFKKVDKMGAYTNAATGMADTNYFIKSNLLNDNDLEEQMKIHASMLQTPKFALDMLEKEKQIVNSEINMITSDPVNIGLNRLIKNLYNIKSSSTDLIGGTTDNINHITREDVVNYYNQNYYPANMTTVITGDVKPDEAIQLVSKYFTSEKQPPQERYNEPLIPTDKPVRQDIISDKAKATTILIGFSGVTPENIEDEYKLTALDMILSNLSSSRLQEKLKKFNTSSFIDEEKISCRKDSPQAKIFTTQTTEENSEKVLKTIYQEIENIKVNPPTEEELEIAKKQMHKVFSSVFETSAQTNDFLGEVVACGNFSAITDFNKFVDNLTVQDLVEVANKYYDTNKAAITVVHPKSANEETIKSNYNKAKEISFGSARHVLNENNVQSYVLPNNMEVVTNNIKNDRATLTFAIELPRNEEQSMNVGAAMILDYMLNQGSINKNQNEMAKGLEKQGISESFSATTHSISAVAEFEASETQNALSVMKEVLNTPRFTEEEFNRAKEFVTEALSITKKSVNDKLYQELFPNEIAGLSKDDIRKSVENSTFEDVKNLYQDIISRSEAHIVMSAPFDKNPELKNNLFVEMSQYPQFQKHHFMLRENYKPIEKTKVLVDDDARNQAKIVEAFTYKDTGNIKDKLSIKLMNMILGGSASSRLFTDLRESRKLAYAVKSNTETIGNTGILSLSIGTTTENKETGEISYDNVKKSIDGFNENIERIKSEKVSDEELESAKLAMKNAMLNSVETKEGKSIILEDGLTSYYGLTYANQSFEMLDKITAEDIQNAAHYVFDSKPTYSILATPNTLEANKELFKNLENA